METWRLLLVGFLGLNAVLGFGYRVYRLTKGGPLGDVTGQAILGLLLGGIALGVAAEYGWARWAAVVYGLLFAVVVMPLWTLAILIPLRPERIDYAFTGVYWLTLVAISVAALAL
jgi:hypothetical protein